MNLSTFLEESATSDPSWCEALSVVRRQLSVPSHVGVLFKSGWNGIIEPVEYMKVMGFSRLNPTCLAAAAEFDLSKNALDAPTIERAISFLGIRLSAVVLAINYTGRKILKGSPPPQWEQLMKEMMTWIEIGYRIGAKAPELGVEGGALLGFSAQAGRGLLMADKPSQFSKYEYSLKAREHIRGQVELDLFGCQSYQVAALAIQQLGFGTEVALGRVLGSTNRDSELTKLAPEVLRWKAGYLWIQALREARNFPADSDVRSYFTDLTPRQNGERNINLEVLYTEVSKVVRGGSNWVWHLPRPGYEETQRSLEA